MTTASEQNLQALTDVDLLVMKKEAINAMYDKCKLGERFGRLIIEQVFCNAETKRKKIISTTHDEQYRSFVDAYPQSLQQVPQYYIASYLGISPEHLGRLRKKF